MAGIRRLSAGNGLDAVTGFHGFTVNAAGDLLYTFANNGDQSIQNGNQLDNYVMYEAATNDYRYVINDAGELIITFTTAS